MPISSGFTPATAMARIQAIGFWPSSRAFSSDMTSSAAAPTLIGELLPAVTLPPSGLNAGGSDPSASSDVSRRMHWSVVEQNLVAGLVAPPGGDDLVGELAGVGRRWRRADGCAGRTHPACRAESGIWPPGTRRSGPCS